MLFSEKSVNHLFLRLNMDGLKLILMQSCERTCMFFFDEVTFNSSIFCAGVSFLNLVDLVLKHLDFFLHGFFLHLLNS